MQTFPPLKVEDLLPNGNKLSTLERFVKNFNKCVKGEYKVLPLQSYNKAHGKLKLMHTCGKVIEISPANLLDVKNSRVKSGCKHCAYKRNGDLCRYTNETFLEVFRQKFPKYAHEYILKDTYTNTDTKITLEHTKCGTKWSVRPRELLQGNQCPTCSKNRLSSKDENEVYLYIRSLLPTEKILRNSKKVLKNAEYDLYLPDRKLAIEYNGIYWHNELLNKGKDYQKFLRSIDKDIRLVCINSYEWSHKKYIVQSRLKYILGIKDNMKRVYARKCTIKPLDSKTKNAFLEEHHLQGKDISNIALGLYYKEELVAIMTLSKPRKALNGKTDMELSRFCVKKDYSVIGGFSKLWKAIIAPYPVGTRFVTYASLTYSVGDVYEYNGFVFSHISKPSYWYFKNHKKDGKLYHRYNYAKYKLKGLYSKGVLKFYDENLSEKEIMYHNGYLTYLDYGNAVYYYIKE